MKRASLAPTRKLKVLEQRFGKEYFAALPVLPGIYRFFNDQNELIYVGKAKNLRRRLSQYKNARRCKAHAKMRNIVKEMVRMEHEICETEAHALFLENEWIQKHRPKWNVAGAFYFLYPMIGTCIKDGYLFLCYTTMPDLFPGFSFHGAFRSRTRTKEAFFALTELLRFIGHPAPKSKLSKEGIKPESWKQGYVYGFRQLPEEWSFTLDALFKGDAFTAVEELSVLLLERPSALADSEGTEERLKIIKRFWRREILPLQRARRNANWKTYPVKQKDRDQIFIALRFKDDYGTIVQRT